MFLNTYPSIGSCVQWGLQSHQGFFAVIHSRSACGWAAVEPKHAHILVQGLQFLHETCQIAHGALNARSCLVSQYWSLKLCDFGLNSVLDELVERDMIVIETDDVESKDCVFFPSIWLPSHTQISCMWPRNCSRRVKHSSRRFQRP